MSTRRSTYPTWVILRSSPIPTVIKRSDVGNNLCQDLLASSHALAVPPLVNDIAESLPWLLWEAPFPLTTCYTLIAINLLNVCEFNNNGHIPPREAHFQLTMFAMGNIMHAFSSAHHGNAMIMLRYYIGERWGQRISFVNFRCLLLESYSFLKNVSICFVLFYTTFHP
jgi:hypothetical protein